MATGKRNSNGESKEEIYFHQQNYCCLALMFLFVLQLSADVEVLRKAAMPHPHPKNYPMRGNYKNERKSR